MGYNTKNYMTQNGDELHIGGKLIVENGGFVEGLPACENQEDSTAATVSALKDDFNALLAKLKATGLMAGDST